MARALGLDDDEIELVQFAALLHDIGHGPFSHVSEHALDRYADRDKLKPNQKKEKIHEIVTAHWICHDPEILQILGQDTCVQVAKLLGPGHGQPALKSIVSGPLDADKQDYLLRDSHFCGVQYGVFDIHQLHRSLVLVGPDDEKELMIDRDGTHAVEQYVLAKYYLTTNVYRHRVRLITDRMLVRAIELGIERDGLEELRNLYTFDGSERFLSNYREWDDARFMGAFGPAGQKTRCSTLLRRLQERRLLKRVFDARVRDFPQETREIIKALSNREHDKSRRAIETEVGSILSQKTGLTVDPDQVIVHAFDIRSVRETSRNDEAGILVNTTPEPRPFTDESTLFASINEGYVDQFVEIYAPVSWETLSDKKRILRECREPIRQAVERACKSEAKGASS